MIIGAALACSFSVAFAGGSDQLLVAWIRERTDKDCAIVFDPERTWPPFTVKSEDATISIQEIARDSKLRFRSDPENPQAVAIDLDWWPLYAFAQNMSGRNGSVADLRLQPSNDPLTPFVTAPGMVLACRELTRHYQSRLAYHWFFEKVRLAIACGDSDRERVLPVAALALGADVVRRGQMWNFEPNYQVLRQRVVGLEQYRRKAKPDGGRWFHQLEFTAEAYRQMTDKQVKDLYRTATQTLEFVAPPESRLAKLGMARLQATYPASSKNPSVKALGVTLATQIDWDKGLGIYLKPASLASSYLSYKQEFVASGGAVRIVL